MRVEKETNDHIGARRDLLDLGIRSFTFCISLLRAEVRCRYRDLPMHDDDSESVTIMLDHVFFQFSLTFQISWEG